MQNYGPWLLYVLGTPDVDILIMDDINAAAEQSVVCHIPAPTTRHVLTGTVNIFVCFPENRTSVSEIT